MKRLYQIYTEQGRKMLVILIVLVIAYNYYQQNKMQFQTFTWKNGVLSHTAVVDGDTVIMVNGYPVKR